jgi:hypothetical protein
VSGIRVYLLCTLLLTALGLSGVAVFNRSVDPTGHWSSPHIPFSEWKQGKVLTVPDQWNERAFRLHEIQQLSFRPDLLLLGSSRVLLADSQMFSGITVFNAGISSASVSDLLHVWLALRANDRIPRAVLIFVDPEMFNSNAPTGGEWPADEGGYRTFLQTHGIAAESGAIKRRVGSWLTETTDLLNGALTWRAAAAAFSPPEDNDRFWTVRDSVHFPSTDTYAYQLDGSLIYKRADMYPKNDQSRLDVPPTTHYIFLDYLKWHLSARDSAIFSALLQDMRIHGVDALALQAPISQAFHSRLKGEAGYRQSVVDLRNLLEDAQHSQLLTHVCDLEDAADAGCEKDEMMDFAHMLKPCVRKVLHQCAVSGQLDLPLSPLSLTYN